MECQREFKSIIHLICFLALIGCGNNDSDKITGSWCLSEGLSAFKLTFSDNKIFTSEVSAIRSFTIDHGVWTAVDNNELVTRFQDGDEQVKNHYTFSVSKNNLTLFNTDDEETQKSTFNYMTYFSEDRNTLELTRCSSDN